MRFDYVSMLLVVSDRIPSEYPQWQITIVVCLIVVAVLLLAKMIDNS